MENQLAYWLNQLSGEMPVLQWPNEVARPPRQTYRGALQPFKFPRQLTESLKALGRREGVTLFMTLLSGLMMLLHRRTGQQDIIVGTLAPSGRKQSEFQRLLGYFLNPVPLRFTVALSLTPNVPQLPAGWSMTYMDVESGGARWDLYVEMSDRADGMIGRAQYNPDLYSPATIHQTLEDFQLLLESVTAHPAQRLSSGS